MPRDNVSMWSGARKLPLLYVLASLTLITASLYWAKAVLIPVALAILLAFLGDTTCINFSSELF